MAERDAVRADPNHYSIEAEDDRVRVLHARYGSGEKSVLHRHPALVAVFLTDAHVRFEDGEGQTQEVQRPGTRC